MFKKILFSALDAQHSKKIEKQLETVLRTKIPFLQGVDAGLFSELADVLETVNYGKGDVIIREGELGDSLYFIVEGRVVVRRQDEDVAELSGGECFGERALLTDETRSATVVAAESVFLLRLKRDDYAELSENYAKIRYRFKKLNQDRTAEGIEHSIQRNLLENAPFLQSAGGSLINELAKVLEPKTYAAGEILIQEGDAGSAFFLIEVGLVEISKDASVVAKLGPGACVGEGALIDGRVCGATVTAVTETVCFVLGRPSFNRIIKRYPVFGRRLESLHRSRL